MSRGREGVEPKHVVVRLAHSTSTTTSSSSSSGGGGGGSINFVKPGAVAAWPLGATDDAKLGAASAATVSVLIIIIIIIIIIIACNNKHSCRGTSNLHSSLFTHHDI